MDQLQYLWERGQTDSDIIKQIFNSKLPYSSRKYVLLAQSNLNYRILRASDLLDPFSINNIPKSLRQFILSEGILIMIRNFVDGKLVHILLRSLTSKQFLMLGEDYWVPYGIGDLINFKYGDLLLLVEGAADRDALARIYPNVLAVWGSKVSYKQALCVAVLTNRVALVLDNDLAGNSGRLGSRNRLESLGVSVSEIYHLSNKDAGQILDELAQGKDDDSRYLEDVYREQIQMLLGEL